MHEITLEHSIDAAHRVVGHEGKCRRLHGHTYRWVVTVRASGLTEVGFVVDFAAIKDVLNAWDHRTLLWREDPMRIADTAYDLLVGEDVPADVELSYGILRLPVNPTSEYLSMLAADLIFQQANMDNPTIEEVTVTCSETPKSSSTWTLHG